MKRKKSETREDQQHQVNLALHFMPSPPLICSHRFCAVTQMCLIDLDPFGAKVLDHCFSHI